MKLTTEVIDEAKLNYDDLNGVICSGGTSRLFCMKDALQETLGNNVLIQATGDLDQAVARGCAIKAALYSHSNNCITIKNPIALNIGLRVYKRTFKPMLQKGN